MNRGVIYVAGVGFIAIGALVGWALFHPTLEKDYLCICGSTTGGDAGGYTAIPITQMPAGTCPHTNADNNLFCN